MTFPQNKYLFLSKQYVFPAKIISLSQVDILSCGNDILSCGKKILSCGNDTFFLKERDTYLEETTYDLVGTGTGTGCLS